MSIVKFTGTVFSNKGKKGNLLPDEDGYYTLVIGGLNTDNSAGEYYTAEGATNLFEQSSVLMRRIKNGALFSEVGHPKRLPGMSMDDYYCRVISIEETNICGHFSEIWLDFEYGRKHPEIGAPNFIAVLGKVKPAGTQAQALKLSLENPKINTSFSVRGLTNNYNKNGKTYRELTDIVTYDFVNEPGIAAAVKANAPALEHIAQESHQGIEVTETNDTLIHRDVLRRVLTERMDTIGMESSKEMFKNILLGLESERKQSRIKDW